ncbi:MAG: hypothetical protein EWV47_18455 [Microcystis viridis Mv_BB_P_19951000_S68]|nr:MAG: hypothetical protein EWV47_18455 [Microcystis viridis Mv_BB_P_19951000_S68]
MRFDNLPFGRTQFAPTLWTKSVTVGAQSLRPPRGGGLLITLSRGRAFENPFHTQVPNPLAPLPRGKGFFVNTQDYFSIHITQFCF